MELIDKAKEVFAGDHYAKQANLFINHVSEHKSVCQLDVRENHCNAMGVAMGGALFTLADFAAAIAANTDCLDPDSDAPTKLKWVSLSSNIHFFKPVKNGAMVTAYCNPIKVGKTTATYLTILATLEANGTVGMVETTMMRVDD